MQRVMRTVALSVCLASGLSFPLAQAQETEKPLPTLLIKGEVVSLDTDEQDVTLIGVRDRYGFETPIFLTGETKFLEGDAEVSKDRLEMGAQVAVEYNFDINTAKRYAVLLRLPVPETAAPVVTEVPAAELEQAPVEAVPTADALTEPAEPAASETVAEPEEGAPAQ